MPKRNSSRPPKKPARLPRFPPAGVRFEAINGMGSVSVTTETAVLWTGCTARTVNRWRTSGRIPPRPLLLLQLHHAGLIVPESWRRAPCAFTGSGELVIGGYVFRRSELEGYGVMLQALRALQRDRDAAKGLPADDGRPRLSLLPGGRAG